ncbi:hypothetical protein J2S78_002903 [Salibacterium salarium]|nr:hypothetical protein [Salibacterium salarium]
MHLTGQVAASRVTKLEENEVIENYMKQGKDQSIA